MTKKQFTSQIIWTKISNFAQAGLRLSNKDKQACHVLRSPCTTFAQAGLRLSIKTQLAPQNDTQAKPDGVASVLSCQFI